MTNKRRAAVIELRFRTIEEKLSLPPNVRIAGAWVDGMRPGVVFLCIEGENSGLPIVAVEGETLQVVSMETETRFR